MSQPPAAAGAPAAALNINVGVLGHVDCGKTSLVAALSTTLSTAALDKHPQSKERGITLDLGFSCFHVPTPPQLAHLGAPQLQFTLVDCPGHASLLRTIITGVQIIDMMMLVIDINKGVQAQTAECLVIGEITSDRLLVVLNKVDQLPEENRPKAIKKATKRLKEALASTRFATAPMVAVAAKPGGEGASSPPQGLQELTEALLQMVPSQPRAAEGPFLFAIDHCFPIKGQGTVLTGTCLQGRCNVGETIELPALKLKKQVKSAQVFKRPVQSIVAGDRAGICVTQLDAGLLERGLAAAPGSVPTFAAAIARVDKIRFYPGEVHSKGTYHIIISHETVMAQVTFFGVPDGQGWPETEVVQHMVQSLSSLGISSTKQQGSSSDSAGGAASQPLTYDWAAQYPYQEQLYGLEGRPAGVAAAAVPGGSHEDTAHHGPQWALLRFAQPVTAPQASLIIGAKLDTDPHGEACRLAFYGRLVALLYAGDMEGPGCRLQKLRVYKEKTKEGSIERILPDGCTVICKGMFKKETDLSVFEGLQVRTGAGEVGCIEGRFGSSGKVRVGFTAALTAPRAPQDNRITLSYKRYVFDESSSRHRLQQ